MVTNDTKTETTILKAAIELFGKYGKDSVSTGKIAKKAGVNKALIFYYFNSKDKLYAKAFKHLIEQFHEKVHSKIITIEPGLNTIELFIREHISYLKKNPLMIRFMVRELLAATDHEMSMELLEFMEIIKFIRNDLLKAISIARSKGEIRDVDPLQTIVNILSLDIFFFLGKPLVKLVSPTTDLASFEEKRIDYVLDLLMNGLCKQPERVK